MAAKPDKGMGPVESGVRLSLVKLGILEPVTALECMAINLAQVLDGTSEVFKLDDNSKFSKDPTGSVATINRELRLTLEDIARQPSPKPDTVQSISDRF